MEKNNKEKKERSWLKEQSERNVINIKDWPPWMQKIGKIEIKGPLQALLISPDHKTRFDILDGKKTVTVRQGWRKYFVGPVMLCCHIRPWAVMADIVDVRHCFLREVTEEECRGSGFKNLEDLTRGLKKYYPDINPDSVVTVIKWQNVRGLWVDHKDFYKELYLKD